ncbi:sensor histidine kinase [Undibacterium oligocarboniphilum]|uniref:histidine kinase n=1 Tax=Undibacterium oligocarboniphilum TaxID=666702 RepID=A0A850QER8_9BURK|nr:ATP-binding protein [Undibacterium oligocarboniphilum]MBC3871462.1 hypothetical protein [Undibacterium oligocarboniphilum]NVO78962.1 hypothetical protein [Undibacterium oligocarboniphilum]
MSFANLSITNRLRLITVLPIFFMTCFSTLVVWAVIDYSMRDQLTASGEVLAQGIARNSEFALLTRNTEDLRHLLCTSIDVSKDIISINVTDLTGKTVVECQSQSHHYVTQVVQVFADVRIQIAAGMKKDDSDLEMSPLKKVIGQVVVNLSTANYKEKLFKLYETIAGLAAVVFLIGITFSRLLSGTLVSTLHEIVKVSKSISRGNYDPYFLHKQSGELGMVQDAITDMARKVGDITRNLESRVQSRTRDLEKQTQLLEKSHQEKKLLIQMNNKAIEAERRAIAFDLHDTLNTLLLSMIGYARHAKVFLGKYNADARLNPAIDYIQSIESNANHLYSLSRDLVSNLRPEVLDEFGLADAIEVLLANQQKLNPQCHYTFDYTPDFPKLNYDFNIVVYRIVQESLSNVVKHSQATLCHIELTYHPEEHDGRVNLHITDNGLGFDPTVFTGRTGVVGMKERAESINARLEIISDKGRGTELLLQVTV